MPRKSLAEIILTEEIGEREEKEGGYYLVIYDFKLTSRRSIPDKFYKNLSRIMEKGRCRFIQKSVILCSELFIARAIAKLARHYGADVKIFRVFPV